MNTMCGPVQRSSGFATFVAVVLITLVSSALLSLTMLLRTDVQRTTRHRSETQLRQLLIAGGVAVKHEIAVDPHISGSRTIPVPAGAEASSILVTYDAPDPSTLIATVTARTERSKTGQVMHFTLIDSAWVLDDIQLIRP